MSELAVAQCKKPDFDECQGVMIPYAVRIQSLLSVFQSFDLNF